MSFIKLQFRPGVNRDNTDYANEGGWYACDKVRFRSGQPQKIGGWKKAGGATFIGVCRQMWAWVTTFADNLLALGTDIKVYIVVDGVFYDITPLRTTNPTMGLPAVTVTMTVTTGSKVVTVTTSIPHLTTTGSYVTVSGSAALGGIPAAEINDNHIVTVVDATHFTFTTTTAATTSASNTSATLAFEIEPGFAIATAGYGWGTGAWGGVTPPPTDIPPSAWGMGSTVPVALPQRDWWLDNFDNDLVMNIRNGAIYWWERGIDDNPASALATRAIRMEDLTRTWATNPDNGIPAGDVESYVNAVPAKVMQILVSQQDKHLIAFGSTPMLSGTTGGIAPPDLALYDPLLIRWADQDIPEDWWPTSLNSAGFIRVSRGSKIVRALPTRQEILVWTDSHLMTLQYLGTTDVFGLQEYADNISIIGPRAVATASGITYWMGMDKFYAYTGRVDTVPCTLREHIFGNMNTDQAPQIVCGTNEGWNEIWWFYPTKGSDFNNAYVIFNYHDQIWYYGSIERTAWLDNPLRRYPIATNTQITTVDGVTTTGPGIVYAHEFGVDDDALPMHSYIQSSDFDLDEGDHFMLVRRIIPDVDFRGSEAPTPAVDLSVRPRNFPGGPVWGDPNDTQRVVTSTLPRYTDQVFMRARARQMAFKIQSEALGVNWQLGACRIDVRPDGTR